MASIYVRNAGSNTSPFDTWVKAATSLIGATAISTSSDTIWVADDHSESIASAQVWACPTSAGLRILCANTHVTEPPTGLATSAVCATTLGNAQSMNGYAYVYGITFQSGSSTSNVSQQWGHIGGNVVGIELDTCTLYIASTGTSSQIKIGSSFSGGVGQGVYVRVINCTLRVSATAQLVALLSGQLLISGLTFHASSSTPTTIFSVNTAGAAMGVTLIEDCNLAGKTATNLFTVSSIGNASLVTIRNCKIPSSITVVTGTFAQYGSQMIRMHNCDSADTHIRVSENQAAGVVISSTAVYRNSGATQADGTVYAWDLTGNATTKLLWPLRSPEFAVWNGSTGSLTATVEIFHDGAANLTDAEVWLELSYQGTSGFPQSTFVTDRIATVLTTAADQPTSSATWTNSVGNPNAQYVSVSINVQEAGYVLARVAWANGTTVWVDPVITIT